MMLLDSEPDEAKMLEKLDIKGITVWDMTYGGVGEDVAYSIQQTSDGGYIVAGYTIVLWRRRSGCLDYKA